MQLKKIGHTGTSTGTKIKKEIDERLFLLVPVPVCVPVPELLLAF
jgi:hypothetical protein